MIFVTVGTIHFDALTRQVDETVGAGLISDDVILQIGYGGEYVPRHCRYIRSAPSLEPFERSADLVVGHGGTGTTIEVLNMGKPLISVSNPALSDNHQQEFLEAMEAVGLVTYCRDIKNLPMLITHPPRAPKRLESSCRLAEEIGNRIARIETRPRVRRALLRRTAALLLRSVELDVASVVKPAAPQALPAYLLIDPAGHA